MNKNTFDAIRDIHLDQIAPFYIKSSSENAKKFISKGDKVKFTVKFKGREMQHVELGKDLMKRIIEDTKDISKVETHPKFEGRQMIMIIQPN